MSPQAKARTDEQLKAAASAPPPSVSDAPPTDAVAAAVAAALEAVQASKAVTPSATTSVDAAAVEAEGEVEAEDEAAGVEAESEGEADDSAFVVWSSRGELPETLVAWGCDEELWRRTKNKKGLIDLMRAGEEAKGRAVRVHRMSEPPAALHLGV